MSTIWQQAPAGRTQRVVLRKFDLFIASACAFILIISVAGCWLMSIHVIGLGRRIEFPLVLLAMLLPVAAYWHEKEKIALRDAALTIPWALLLFELLPFPVLIAARLRMPLRDALLAHIDQSLGANVPAIMAWVRYRWIGPVLIHSYYLLQPCLIAAIFIPALTGKVRQAREFLTANVIAFLIAVPIFALFPAVGPWYIYGFHPEPAQHLAQLQLLDLRLPGAYLFSAQEPGIVCFPSFHVVWAILCAAALWEFRPLRIPIAVFSVMIILSTVTTGWHYFIDVLGGMVLASLSLLLAKLLLQHRSHPA